MLASRDDNFVDVVPVPLRTFDPHESGNGKLAPLELDLDDEEDSLLDLQRQAHSRRWQWRTGRFPLPLPLPSFTPPEWWRRLSTSQRLMFSCTSVALLIVVIAAIISVALPDGSGAWPSYGSVQQLLRLQPMPTSQSTICSWGKIELPEGVAPSHYDLHLATPMVEPWQVDGEVGITLAVSQLTPCIVLHVNGISINDVELELMEADGSVSSVEGVVVTTTQYQQVVLAFPGALPLLPAQPVLRLRFSYPLQEGLDGFYRSSYSKDGKSYIMASTQFESIAARKAFPCFDDPGLKATFKVQLTVPPEPLVALSNMPLEGRSPSLTSPGLVTYSFLATPPMSTYLVAWVVGEMASVGAPCDTPLGGRKPLAVWAPAGRDKGSLATALAVACSSVSAFERLLQVPYALPKLDLVGIPNFGAGAMENWGLLMFREASLLLNPAGGDDISQEWDVALTVAHEVAHQWFGDLVTLQHWGELWLNEGFATYFEEIGAAGFRPGFGYFDTFFSDVAAPGLDFDAVRTAHPLSVTEPLKSLSQIDNWFDDISYLKGASVLRMLRAYLAGGGGEGGAPTNDPPLVVGGDGGQQRMLRASAGLGTDAPARGSRRALRGSAEDAAAAGPVGGDPFMVGLSAYLQQLRFGSTNHTALWAALSASTRQPVDEWMATWSVRRGFPIVTVSEPRADQAGGGGAAAAGSFVVTQVPYHARRLWLTGIPQESDEYCNDFTAQQEDASWWVPLAYTRKGESRRDGGGGRSLLWLAFDNCEARLPPLGAPAAGGGGGGADNGGWVLLNAGRYGYYRTNYSDSLWEALLGAVDNPKEIGGVDFAGLLDDAAALSQVHQLNITIFLRLAEALAPRRAPELSPWSVGLHWLQRFSSLIDIAGAQRGAGGAGGQEEEEAQEPPLDLQDGLLESEDEEDDEEEGTSGGNSTAAGAAAGAAPAGAGGGAASAGVAPSSSQDWLACSAALKAWVTDSITGPFIASVQIPGSSDAGLGFNVSGGEPPEARLLRPRVLNAAGRLGDARLAAAAAELLKSAVGPAGSSAAARAAAVLHAVHPDVRSAVYTLAVSTGDANVYDMVLGLFKAADDAADKRRLLGALACAPSEVLLERSLGLALSAGDVATQDVGSLLSGAASCSGLGFNKTWEFVLANTDALLARFPGGDAVYNLGRSLSDLAPSFTDAGVLPRLQDLVAAHPDLLAPEFLDSVQEAVTRNELWLQVEGADLCGWLQHQRR